MFIGGEEQKYQKSSSEVALAFCTQTNSGSNLGTRDIQSESRFWDATASQLNYKTEPKNKVKHNQAA